MDITSLIKIHRKELLKDHLNKSMHINYKDGHFEKSIILMSTDARKEEPSQSRVGHLGSRSASSSASLSRKAVKPTVKAPISCPVKNCFKEYKVKTTMLAHICREHPEKASRQAIRDEVDTLFAKSSGSSSGQSKVELRSLPTCLSSSLLEVQ